MQYIQSRYFIYFFAMAVAFGSAIGYLSSALTAAPSNLRVQSSSSRPPASQISQLSYTKTKRAPSNDEQEDHDMQELRLGNARRRSSRGKDRDKSDQDRFEVAMKLLAEKRKRMASIS
jgi:hypothetical protein